MGAFELHGTVDAQMYLCIRNMKNPIRDFCSPYKTARNARFVHEKLLNIQIEKSLICYIESSTSKYIKILSSVRPRFMYIL